MSADNEEMLGLRPGVGMRHTHGYYNKSSIEQSTLVIILINSTGAPDPAFSAYSAFMEEQATPALIYIRPEQTNFKTPGQYQGKSYKDFPYSLVYDDKPPKL
jgi:hypothetical protein